MDVYTFDDFVRAKVPPERWVAWAREALLLKEDAIMAPKISLKPSGIEHCFYNTRPCVIPAIDRAGVKLVTRYPKRRPSVQAELLLHDLASGELLALMDATYLTTVRTGAVAALTIDLLAKGGYETVGVMGLGNTATATVLALLSIADGPLRFRLLRYKDHAERFEARFRDASNASFEVVDSPRELIERSDVVVSCVTAADGDFVEDDGAFAPGILVVPVHTRGFMGCDLTFDRVFCDDRGHVRGFGNYAAFEPRLTEIAEVVRGEREGRASDAERILAYNIGIALQDVYFAAKFMERMEPSHEPIELLADGDPYWL